MPNCCGLLVSVAGQFSDETNHVLHLSTLCMGGNTSLLYLKSLVVSQWSCKQKNSNVFEKAHHQGGEISNVSLCMSEQHMIEKLFFIFLVIGCSDINHISKSSSVSGCYLWLHVVMPSHTDAVGELLEALFHSVNPVFRFSRRSTLGKGPWSSMWHSQSNHIPSKTKADSNKWLVKTTTLVD